MDKYVPEYSPGEIAIQLKENYRNRDFVEIFVDILRYELAGSGKFEGYIIKTGKGDEKRAIREFLKKRKFVENAYMRDLKFERWDEVLNELKDEIGRLEEISESAGTSDNKMKGELEKFIRKAKTAKKKL